METFVYIFIEAEQTETWKITQELKKYSEVVEAHCVSGPYDIIVQLKVPDIKSLSEFLNSSVYPISGVRRTLSNIVVD